MTIQKRATSWLPTWVSTLDTPVWVSGPDRKLCYVNDHAEALLGRSGDECVGLPCHKVVGATDTSGRPFCGPRCRLARLADRHQKTPPVELRLRRPDGTATWVCVLLIAVRAPDGEGPWLVHCVLSTDRAHRLEDYLTKVALRTSTGDAGPQTIHARRRMEVAGEVPRAALTKRQTEVLRLLAEDPDLRSIGMTLHISHATVRNHVQHILQKLGVHSIREAVAYHILMSD